MNAKQIALVIVMALLMVACAAPESYTVVKPDAMGSKKLAVEGIGGVHRFVDSEAGVVCWIYPGYGLACLPISETRLILG